MKTNEHRRSQTHRLQYVEPIAVAQPQVKHRGITLIQFARKLVHQPVLDRVIGKIGVRGHVHLLQDPGPVGTYGLDVRDSSSAIWDTLSPAASLQKIWNSRSDSLTCKGWSEVDPRSFSSI